MEYFFKNETARWFTVVNLYLHKEKLDAIYSLRINRQQTRGPMVYMTSFVNKIFLAHSCNQAHRFMNLCSPSCPTAAVAAVRGRTYDLQSVRIFPLWPVIEKLC